MIYQYAINIEEITDINKIKVLLNDISIERKNRIIKFYFTKDKVRCLLAEALVRYALCDKYSFKYEKIIFGYSKYGKPLLASDNNIHFNLSHSGEWVVCAIGDTLMGIDVEEMRNTQLPSVCKSFSEQEIQFLDNMPKENQVEAFYRIWTLKESFVKYNGFGLSYPFESFSLDFCNQKIRLIQNDRLNLDISFISKKVDERHWYALCMKEYEKVNDMKIITIKELLENRVGKSL